MSASRVTLPVAGVVATAVVVALAGPIAPSAAGISAASSHALRLRVVSLYRPCHKRSLIGTFTVSGLHKGQSQIDATTASSAVLLHTFATKKSTITLRKTELKYQFPKGAPAPTGTLNVYVVQVKGERQPSAVVPVTVTGCRK